MGKKFCPYDQEEKAYHKAVTGLIMMTITILGGLVYFTFIR